MEQEYRWLEMSYYKYKTNSMLERLHNEEPDIFDIDIIIDEMEEDD